MAITKVIREAARYAKNNAPKRVSAKNSRKAANDAKKRGSIRRTEKVKIKNETRGSGKRKPPKGIPIPPKPEKMSKAFQTKSGAKKLLKKFGVPGKIIAGVLALTAANQLNKPKTTKTKTPGPGNKSNAPNPFNNINPPAKRKGPGGPRMTSMRAPSTGPKPRNKNETKRPTRPSKQGSFGR